MEELVNFFPRYFLYCEKAFHTILAIKEMLMQLIDYLVLFNSAD